MKKFLRQHIKLLRSGYFAVVVVLILVSLTSVWLRTTFFDTGNFATIVTTSVTLPSSRDAIAKKVVNEALPDGSIVKATIGPRLEGLISGALGSSLTENTITSVAENVQMLVTTPKKPPIVLDLTQAKSIVKSGQEILNRNQDGESFNVDQIPDKITLIETKNIPNVYQYGILTLWLGPVTFIAAMVLLGWWVKRGKPNNYLLRIRYSLLIITVAGVVSYSVRPLVKPVFLSIAADAPTQTLLGNVYEAFMAPFTTLSVTIIISSLLGALVVLVVDKVIRKYRLIIKIEKRNS